MMQSYQWFLLGMMVAYTPTFLFLAFALRDTEADSQKKCPAVEETIQAKKKIHATEPVIRNNPIAAKTNLSRIRALPTRATAVPKRLSNLIPHRFY